MAMEFRQEFHRDVFIDLLCYRKYGHNEGDEPRFTQPLLYDIIRRHPNPRDIYLKQLLDEKTVTAEEADKLQKDFNAMLQTKLDASKKIQKATVGGFMETTWSLCDSSDPSDFESSPSTKFGKRKL